MNLEPRIAGEKAVLTKVVKAGIKKGWTVSLYDGEKWAVKRSVNATEVIDAAMSTDEDIIRFRDSEKKIVGSVYFLYGNSPGEVINDYSVTLHDFLDSLGIWR